MTARIYYIPADGAWLLNRRIATRFGHGTIIAYAGRQMRDGGWMVTVKLDRAYLFEITTGYASTLVDVYLPLRMIADRGLNTHAKQDR